jgi:hypothetical protein
MIQESHGGLWRRRSSRFRRSLPAMPLYGQPGDIGERSCLPPLVWREDRYPRSGLGRHQFK